MSAKLNFSSEMSSPKNIHFYEAAKSLKRTVEVSRNDNQVKETKNLEDK